VVCRRAQTADIDVGRGGRDRAARLAVEPDASVRVLAGLGIEAVDLVPGVLPEVARDRLQLLLLVADPWFVEPDHLADQRQLQPPKRPTRTM
jgi:hypothetical protein